MNDRAMYLELLNEFQCLTDEINSVLIRETNTDLWDGDEAASEILRVFIHWLPDLIRHREARSLRERASLCGSEDIRRTLHNAANDLEPFYVGKDSAGVPSWYRTRDHRLVPWRVADDPTPDEQKRIMS